MTNRSGTGTFPWLMYTGIVKDVATTNAGESIRMDWGGGSSTGAATDLVDATLNPLMTLRRNGKLGIGTTSPISSLQVKVPSSSSLVWGTTITNPYNDATANQGIGLKLQMDGSAPWYGDHKWCGIAAKAEGNYSDELGLAFYTQGTIGSDPGNAPTEKMRIDADGNVGIGTATPNAKLHIKSSSGADGIAIFNDAGGTGGTLALSSGVRGGLLISNSGGGSNGSDGYSSQPIVLSGGGTAATDGDLRGGSIWSKWGGTGGQYGIAIKGANDGDAVPAGASAPVVFVTKDKVGIGTSLPKTDVDINGNIRIGGTLSQGHPGYNFVQSMRKFGASSSADIAFTFSLRLYCNWIPIIIKINVSSTDGNSGEPYAWSYTVGYRGADCGTNNPMNTGGILIATAMDGADPGASYLSIALGGNNVLTVTTKRNGRDNILAEVEVIAFGGIYL
jgi:hypothetical protein